MLRWVGGASLWACVPVWGCERPEASWCGCGLDAYKDAGRMGLCKKEVKHVPQDVHTGVHKAKHSNYEVQL